MSTTTNPALASLKDIHIPDAIGLWPLAYGYWILIGLTLILCLLLGFWLRKQYLHRAAKRQALKQLAQLPKDNANYPIEVNAILKRAALSYLPRQQVARLNGQGWNDWLMAQYPLPELGALLDRRYQATALTAEQRLQLAQLAKAWLTAALPLKAARAKPTTPDLSTGRSQC